MKFKYFLLFLFCMVFLSCNKKESPNIVIKTTPLISFVDPFIGTGGHGHTYPGATMPFGMMQLSPCLVPSCALLFINVILELFEIGGFGSITYIGVLFEI